MLETATEIVLLVANIDLNSNIERCLQETGHGQWDSLEELSTKIKTTIATTCRMLKTNDATRIPTKGTAINRDGSRGSGLSAKDDVRSLYSADGGPTTHSVTPYHNRNKTTPPYQHQKLVNLITLLVHKRDVIQELLGLLSKGVQKVSHSFQWSSQVKFEYSKEDGLLRVKFLDAGFSYGMEYQGACPRLVLTPTTDKCFVSLAQAVKNHMVGMCVGPTVSFK